MQVAKRPVETLDVCLNLDPLGAEAHLGML